MTQTLVPIRAAEENQIIGSATPQIPAGPSPVMVNGRYRAHKVAGQQRYANELLARMGSSAQLIEPATPLKGAKGHAWEQVMLPYVARKRTLWSPCQTGPIFSKNQIVTFHDIFALENPEWFSTAYAWWYKRMIPRLAHNARHLIAVSDYTKRRIERVLGVAGDKITVIHSGIGSEFRLQPKQAIQSMIRMLALPSTNYVLSVSSLEPRKNLPRILAAWNEAAPRLPEDCWLVLAGGKGSSGVFASEDLSGKAPRVHFTGYVPEELLPALYAGASVFLYPSLAEGFGFPVLEAMRCGAPSITSNCSSLPEVTGDAALQVDPLSVSAIAQGLLTLLGSEPLRTEFRGRGLERSGRFQWDRAARETLGVFHPVEPRKESVTNHAR